MPFVLNIKKGTTINHPEVKVPGLVAVEVSDKVANQMRNIVNAIVFDEVQFNDRSAMAVKVDEAPKDPKDAKEISQQPASTQKAMKNNIRLEKELMKPVTEEKAQEIANQGDATLPTPQEPR
jgi:hypothetical protein